MPSISISDFELTIVVFFTNCWPHFFFGNCRQYSSLEVAAEYFRSGADKISIGSDAVYAAEEYLKTGVCFSKYIVLY
jgi:hypothetical protein